MSKYDHKITIVQREINEINGRKKQLEDDIQKDRTELRTSNLLLEREVEARLILQEVAKRTQDSLTYQINDIVELCLRMVFPDRKYRFKLEFVTKSNKTVTLIYLEDDDGMYYNIPYSCGGGVGNIVSLGLRIALWKLRRPKTAPVLVLDEPFRDVSPDRQEKAGELLKLLSKTMDLQFVIISHKSWIINAVDKVFLVVQKLKESVVKTISKEEAVEYVQSDKGKLNE